MAAVFRLPRYSAWYRSAAARPLPLCRFCSVVVTRPEPEGDATSALGAQKVNIAGVGKRKRIYWYPES
ncbi:hypothetical protein ACU4GD_16920 [Cupriavidus basilensis]